MYVAQQTCGLYFISDSLSIFNTRMWQKSHTSLYVNMQSLKLKGIWTWYLLFQIPLNLNRNSKSISRSDKSNTLLNSHNLKGNYHIIAITSYKAKHIRTGTIWPAYLLTCGYLDFTTDNISIISRHGDSNVEETENQPLIFSRTSIYIY